MMGKKTEYEKNNHIWKLYLTGAVLFAASFLLLFLSRKASGMAEWYAAHVYAVTAMIPGRILGVLPFSVVEMLLYGVFTIFMAGIVRNMLRCMRKREMKTLLQRGAVTIWLFAAVLFLLYTLNCGINYQRETFSEREDIAITEYSLEELTQVCELLTEDVNRYAMSVPRDEAGIMTLKGEEKQGAVLAMKELGKRYASLEGYYPKPKGLLGSWILSVQSLTGVYSPFTVEANYNQDMVAYNIPFTMCHELSHLRGFMEEKEANFIAYLACMESEDDTFRYSGSLLGWIYCTNVLHQADYETWKLLRESLCENAQADLQANSAFWKKYDGTVARVSNQINDGYLKVNGQEEGVGGYDRMVDLMMSYYKKQGMVSISQK